MFCLGKCNWVMDEHKKVLALDPKGADLSKLKKADPYKRFANAQGKLRSNDRHVP